MNKGIYIATLLATILTARAGRITFNGHTETWYNMRMTYVCQRAQQIGIQGDYWVRDDGVKMYGPWVIVAANWDIHPYGTVLETSRGYGMVLDTHTADDKEIIDIATNWGKGGKK